MIVAIRRADESLIGRASGSLLEGTLWPAIQQVVADEFHCHPDDVDTFEVTEGEFEGLEAVIVDGEVKGFIRTDIETTRRASARLTGAPSIAATTGDQRPAFVSHMLLQKIETE
jgi:hypothetical protein